MTTAEYYTEIEALLPSCCPREIDVELTRFYAQFQTEVLRRATIDPVKQSNTSSGLARRHEEASFNTGRVVATFGAGHVAPKWVFDPDELRDKVLHLRCHLIRTVNPYDDDCWARAARSAHGLTTLLANYITSSPAHVCPGI